VVNERPRAVPVFGAPKLSERDKLASLARVLVRAGYMSQGEAMAEVAVAAREDARETHPQALAAQLVAGARGELSVEQRSWPLRTDHDRLVTAFAALRAQGVAVLEAVADHWAADGVLKDAAEAGRPLSGVLWFTAPDVWHAVEHGMLEVNVWHADSANVAAGDALLTTVIDTLAQHHLDAHFDEGRVELSAYWHRRLAD